MRASGVRRAFTLKELLITIGVVAVIGVLLAAWGLSALSQLRSDARRNYDSSHIRAILQGLVMWAGNNQDRYPLPSLVDLKDATVAEPGPSKDTTANIMSMLVYQGLIPVDFCVSPAEVNASIRVMEGYEFHDPKKAVRPGEALWDPAFSADFVNGVGNLSYAHRLPSGPRLKEWGNTFNENLPVVGNRGPEIKSAAKGKAPNVTYTLVNPKSNTLLIHGSRTKWEGNLGYNDNHTSYEVGPSGLEFAGGKRLTYIDAAGTAWDDNLFYDEPDDPTGANAFLGIFTKAGPAPSDFVSIWD